MIVVGDVARVIDCEHKTAPRSTADVYGYSIGTRDVRNGRINLDSAKPVARSTFEEWTRRAVPAVGDLILSREAPMGEVGLVPGEAPVCLGQRTVLLQVDQARIEPKFLKYSIMAPAQQHWIQENSLGTTVLHLNVADVRGIPIPYLPPVEEQRRIVDLLEDHLSRLDAANAYVRTGTLRASRWHGGLIDDLLWREDYPRVEVRSLLREPMRNGRSDRAVAQGATGTRTLTITAVTKNVFTAENTKITTTTADRARGLWLEPGDVFVQRSNTPELVGTSARYNGQPGWAIFPDLLIRLRADETQMDSRFLAAALRSEKGHRQLRAKAKGAAGSMPKIDQAAIGCALVPLPPLAQQAEILAQLHEASNALARLRGELSAVTRRSASLRMSLLAAAFSGRLTGDLEVAGV